METTEIIILVAGLSFYAAVIWVAWKVVHHE